MALPLEPYTLIDLTRARSGPTCVRQLAEMGAKVIKVENKGEDDFARDGFDFQNLHRNKRSITLDLKNPRGVEVLKRLAARADVLVENYRHTRATITPPEFPPPSSRRRTVTSTSRRPGRSCIAGSARRSARRRSSTTRASRRRPTAPRTVSRSTRSSTRCS